jgi:hypothetical protein
MNKIISFMGAVLLTCSSAHADNRLERLNDKMTKGNPLEVLKKVFQDSQDSLTFDDIRKLGQHCAITQDGILSDNYLVVRKASKVIQGAQAATPKRGPLFPGTPGKAAQLAIKYYPDTFNYPAKEEDLSNNQSKNDFDSVNVVSSASEITMSREGHSWKQSLTIRKNGNMLSYLVRQESLADEVSPSATETYYGYCWEE